MERNIMGSFEFWYGKNVLITGGNGFVASNLALKLIKLGANVHVTMRHYSEHDTIKMLANEDVKYDTEITDMREYTEVKNILDRQQIDTIFHLAASAIVSQASNSPLPTLYNNIITTINILEAARSNNVNRIIIASTDKSYGDHSSSTDHERIPYREHFALRGLDIYSTSKVCADMISQAIALQYRQHILITRCCNIYGPGDFNFSRLIPKTIMRLLSGKAPVINEGNSNVLREYVFVDDVTDGYVFLAEHIEDYYKKEYPQKGEDAYGWPCFNMGSYTEDNLKDPHQLPNIKNVKEVIGMIMDILTVKGEYSIEDLLPIIIPKGANFIEIPDQYLDSSKIHSLGFSSKTSLKEGLKKSIKWYEDHFDFAKKYGAQYLQ
jgi:CDP-glucose 4,6-dehydratase